MEVWYCDANTIAQTHEDGISPFFAQDQARLRKLVSPDAKLKFLRSRLLLTDILNSSQIARRMNGLTYTDDNKPICLSDDDMYLSWSRSNDALVFAITSIGEIGIDLELIRDISYKAMLKMICTQEEISEFHQLDEANETRSFFRLWTIKEAILKSTGSGFQTSAKLIHVPQPAYTQKDKLPFVINCLERQFEITQFEDDKTIIALAISK